MTLLKMYSAKEHSKELILSCSCGEPDYMGLMRFERDVSEEDPATEYEMVYVRFAVRGIDVLWAKMKAVWGILFHGEVENYGITLGIHEMTDLKNWAEATLESWKRMEEEDEARKKAEPEKT